MSLRTISRVVIVSTFALGALTASACGSSKKSSSSSEDGGSDASTAKDSGTGKDSGSMMSTDSGSGTDAAMMTLMCGAQSCAGELVGGAKLPACCGKDTKNADACGIDLSPLGKLIGQNIPASCSLRDQPGKDSMSCGAVIEMFVEPKVNGANYANLSMAEKMDSKLSINLAKSVTLSLPGCCLPSGECGVVMNEVTGGNLHLGCNSLAAVSSLLGGGAKPGDGGAPAGDAGAPPPAVKLSCDPASGTFIPPMFGGDGGLSDAGH